MDWLIRHDPALRGAPAEGFRNVEDDFDRVAQAAPWDQLADGLAAAFRSDRTPPFPDMLAQLFRRSPGRQRAGIWNALVSALGPAVLSQIMARHGGGSGGAIAPEQIPTEAVKEAAAQAERKDPSIIDRLSRMYAEQPQVVKTLGAVALAIALGRLAQRQGTL